MGAHVLLMWIPPFKGWALLGQPPAWPEEEAERGQLHPLGPVLGQVSSGVGGVLEVGLSLLGPPAPLLWSLAGQGHVGRASESMFPEGTRLWNWPPPGFIV